MLQLLTRWHKLCPPMQWWSDMCQDLLSLKWAAVSIPLGVVVGKDPERGGHQWHSHVLCCRRMQSNPSRGKLWGSAFVHCVIFWEACPKRRVVSEQPPCRYQYPHLLINVSWEAVACTFILRAFAQPLNITGNNVPHQVMLLYLGGAATFRMNL